MILVTRFAFCVRAHCRSCTRRCLSFAAHAPRTLPPAAHTADVVMRYRITHYWYGGGYVPDMVYATRHLRAVYAQRTVYCVSAYWIDYLRTQFGAAVAHD